MDANKLYLFVIATYDWTRIQQAFDYIKDPQAFVSFDETAPSTKAVQSQALVPALEQLAILIGEDLPGLNARFQRPRSSLMEVCTLSMDRLDFIGRNMSVEEICKFVNLLDKDRDLSLFLGYVLMHELLNHLSRAVARENTQLPLDLTGFPRWFKKQYLDQAVVNALEARFHTPASEALAA